MLVNRDDDGLPILTRLVRELVRLALAVGLPVGILLALIHVGNGFYARSGDGEARFREAALAHFRLSHPTHDSLSISSGCCETGLLSMELEFTAGPVAARRRDPRRDQTGEQAGGERFRFTKWTLGGMDVPYGNHWYPLDSEFSGVGNGLPHETAEERRRSRRILDRLPEGDFAAAVVELEHPLPLGDLPHTPPGAITHTLAISKSPRKPLHPPVLIPRYADCGHEAEKDRPCPGSPFEYARMWHDELVEQGLWHERPGWDEALREERVYAFLVSDLRVKDLSALLKDPKVRSVRVTDTARDLTYDGT
ncbi:hypothetical protein [Bailinhaonella thermotolerans]|uniref:Uncharacterized protein n=1 Tax=Bailinhaonella thermotolerans TaxID=1070861 RepID=A0A3A4AUK2_9ACTN|nr:hypothetical protein [Bailinhaonella thermotolerans]RJL31965.1 hypothetical protein D5H75_16090 [Bailinhaonella thermotolerans]